jgi:hypothetical protein
LGSYSNQHALVFEIDVGDAELVGERHDFSFISRSLDLEISKNW